MAITTAPQAGGMPSGQIYGAGLQPQQQNPLAGALLSIGNRYLETQTNKKIAEKQLEGQLAILSGASIESVRSQETFLNQIFGKSATMEGAEQAYAKASVVNAFNDLTSEVDQFGYKMKPEEFNKHVKDRLAPLTVTGDAALDSQMQMAMLDLNQKIYGHYAKRRHAYEQEEYISSNTALIQSEVEKTAKTGDVRTLKATYEKLDQDGEVGRKLVYTQALAELRRGDTTTYDLIRPYFDDENVFKFDNAQINNLKNAFGSSRGSGTKSFADTVLQKQIVSHFRQLAENPDTDLNELSNNMEATWAELANSPIGNSLRDSLSTVYVNAVDARYEFQQDRKYSETKEGLLSLTSRANTDIVDIMAYLDDNPVLTSTLDGLKKTLAEVDAFVKAKGGDSTQVFVNTIEQQLQDYSDIGDIERVNALLNTLGNYVDQDTLNNTTGKYVAKSNRVNEAKEANQDFVAYRRMMNDAMTSEQLADVMAEIEQNTPEGGYNPLFSQIVNKEYEDNRKRVISNENTVDAVAIRLAEEGVIDGVTSSQAYWEEIADHFQKTGRYDEAYLVKYQALVQREAAYSNALETGDYSNIAPDQVESFLNYSARELEMTGGMEDLYFDMVNNLPPSSESMERAGRAFSFLVGTDGNASTPAINELQRIDALRRQGRDDSFALRQVPDGDRDKVSTMLDLLDATGGDYELAILEADRLHSVERKSRTALDGFFDGNHSDMKKFVSRTTSRVMSDLNYEDTSLGLSTTISNMVTQEINKAASLGSPLSERQLRNNIRTRIKENNQDGIIGFTASDKGNNNLDTKRVINHYLRDNGIPTLAKDDTVVYQNERFLIYRGEMGHSNMYVIPKYDVYKNEALSNVEKEKKKSRDTMMFSPTL